MTATQSSDHDGRESRHDVSTDPHKELEGKLLARGLNDRMPTGRDWENILGLFASPQEFVSAVKSSNGPVLFLGYGLGALPPEVTEALGDDVDKLVFADPFYQLTTQELLTLGRAELQRIEKSDYTDESGGVTAGWTLGDGNPTGWVVEHGQYPSWQALRQSREDTYTRFEQDRTARPKAYVPIDNLTSGFNGLDAVVQEKGDFGLILMSHSVIPYTNDAAKIAGVVRDLKAFMGSSCELRIYPGASKGALAQVPDALQTELMGFQIQTEDVPPLLVTGWDQRIVLTKS